MGEVQRLINEIMPQASSVGGRTGTALITPDGKAHHFDVMWLQQSLNFLVPRTQLQVDGKMGPLTTEAIKAFQKSRGLEPDGWAGVLTLATIEDELRTAGRK
jgi:peptidoglycan hydrolase-like protein with peptidoglycan-binding domain